MIKIFLENTKGKEELAAYLINELGQTLIGDEIKVLNSPTGADLLIDLSDCVNKEHILLTKGEVFGQLMKIKVEKYNRKLPKFYGKRIIQKYKAKKRK